MKKKNRPEKQAANSDIRTSDITPTTSPVQVPKRTPKSIVPAFICCVPALRDGQKTIFCVTAAFRLAGTTLVKLSVDLIFS